MARFSAAYLENLARRWQAHYQRTSGKTAPNVVWEKGWFIIEGRRYRRTELERMVERLFALPACLSQKSEAI
jgi:hypothetical protein